MKKRDMINWIVGHRLKHGGQASPIRYAKLLQAWTTTEIRQLYEQMQRNLSDNVKPVPPKEQG